MSDDELVEKAAKAIWGESSDFGLKGRWESDLMRGEFREQARAALAVFREHTAPAGDEWEYGLIAPQSLPGEYGRDDRAHLVSRNREHIERQQRRGHPSIRAMRRRKAGPWIDMTEGDSDV